jgi:hypothetical protein
MIGKKQRKKLKMQLAEFRNLKELHSLPNEKEKAIDKD